MQNKSASDPKAKSDAENAMKKKTAEELAQMAIVNRAFSAESSDEPPPPLSQKRSESSLEPLNSQLKSNPHVKAFNSAENQHEKNNNK